MQKSSKQIDRDQELSADDGAAPLESDTRSEGKLLGSAPDDTNSRKVFYTSVPEIWDRWRIHEDHDIKQPLVVGSWGPPFVLLLTCLSQKKT